MDSTKWFVAGTILVTIILLGVLVSINKSPGPQPGESLSENLWTEVVNKPSHERGKVDNKVTIVEFGDLQCPACALAQEPLKSYLDQNQDVHFIWHHFPLSQHQYARIAAQAAEAAGDKFFEMSDLLFKNQSEWTSGGDLTSIFGGYAESIGLNRKDWQAAFESSPVEVIDKDVALGDKIGINATPTLFVNRVRLEGIPQSVGEWEQVVDSILNESDEGQSDQVSN